MGGDAPSGRIGGAATAEVHADRVIAGFARRQRNVVAYWQLIGAGVSRRAIERRIESGHLVRIHKGVYALGHLDPVGHATAGLFACRGQGVLSHRTAAAMYDLLPHPAAVSVTTPRNGPRPPRLHVHRVREMPPAARRDGLPITTVPQTLLDLAATADHDEVAAAVDQAHVHGLTTSARLTAFLTSRAARRGTRTLRAMVDGPRTRSPLEIRFFGLLRAARLPLPLTNVLVNGHRVDFYWPDHNLVVETDGWATHGNRRSFERDHARDLDHAAAGVRVLRITRRQLDREPHAVTARLGAVLL